VTAAERFSSRKFSLAVFFALTSTLALFTGDIEGDVYRSILALVLGLYAFGNVASEYVKKG